MGYSFFEFSRSYWKGGPEMEFGMYGSLAASFHSDSISCHTNASTVMNQAEFNEVLCMQIAI